MRNGYYIATESDCLRYSASYCHAILLADRYSRMWKVRAHVRRNRGQPLLYETDVPLRRNYGKEGKA